MENLLRRIQGEFLEMPGLRLTRGQAERLWGLYQQTCTDVLASLVVEKFLVCAADGRYSRLSEGRIAAAREISPTRRGNLPQSASVV
jgi:hypothetical protein